MIDGEITHLWVSTKEPALLLIDHEFLDEFSVFGHVQMKTRRWLSGPAWNFIMIGHLLSSSFYKLMKDATRGR